MKVIDAEKLEGKLLDLQKQLTPTNEAVLKSEYWLAVSLVLDAVTTAVSVSTVEL